MGNDLRKKSSKKKLKEKNKIETETESLQPKSNGNEGIKRPESIHSEDLKPKKDDNDEIKRPESFQSEDLKPKKDDNDEIKRHESFQSEDLELAKDSDDESIQFIGQKLEEKVNEMNDGIEIKLFNNLWKYIFYFITGGKDLKALCVVNKQFNQILKEKEIWKRVIEKDLENENLKISLEFLENENSFENVWKSFSSSQKIKMKKNPRVIDIKKGYFLSSQKDANEIWKMKNKKGENLFIINYPNSKDFRVSFFCGYLDKKKDLAIGRGKYKKIIYKKNKK